MMRRPPMPGHGPLPVPPPPVPLPGKISNVTNSNDPSSKESRVFVGNLNTIVIKKEDVDAIFHRYGIVTGISMHKGYAFVQFNHPAEARRAVSFENGQVYAGQPLDLNIVSEPKQRPGQKRPNFAQNERRPPMQVSPSMPPIKKPRQDGVNQSLQRTLVTLSNTPAARPVRRTFQSAATKTAAAVVKRATASIAKSSTTTKTTVNSAAVPKATNASAATTMIDILICGVCKMQFTSLHSLAQHKKVPCRLKASCQCQTNPPPPKDDEPIQFDCATCDASFDSAWALCQHGQSEHKLSIFKTENTSLDASSKSTATVSKNEDTAESTKAENDKGNKTSTPAAGSVTAKK